MKNGIFTTDLTALVEALMTGVGLAVLGAFAQIALGAHFDVFTADWGGIAQNMVNVGVVSGVGSLVKDFLSTNSGSLLGITAPYVTTPPTQ